MYLLVFFLWILLFKLYFKNVTMIENTDEKINL